MHGRRSFLFLGVLILGVLVLAGCRPEVEFDLDGRQSEIDAVAVTATLTPDGVVHVEQRYRFASDEGGTVAFPKDLVDESLAPQAIDAVGGIRNVTLDGQSVAPTQGTFEPELRVRAKRATIAYDELGATERYADIGIVRVDVLPSPEDASRQDPDVDLTGTLVLPPGAPALVDAHLHGGRDRKVKFLGSTITFSEQAPIWQPSHSLDVAFPESWLSGMAPTPIAFAGSFATEQAARDQSDTTTESTLGGLDDQAELSRWILTAVAFGLPAIFWTIVVIGLVRRLRERKRVVGNVPDHLSDPPTAVDPAIVAVLDGEGRPAKTAVAGTVLDLANRKAIEVREYGDKVLVKVPLETVGVNDSEQLVLSQLRAQATPEGVLERTRLWKQPTRWWRTYRRDLVKRARHGVGRALDAAGVAVGCADHDRRRHVAVLLHPTGRVLRDGVRGDDRRLHHLVREWLHAHEQGVAPARALALVREVRPRPRRDRQGRRPGRRRRVGPVPHLRRGARRGERGRPSAHAVTVSWCRCWRRSRRRRWQG